AILRIEAVWREAPEMLGNPASGADPVRSYTEFHHQVASMPGGNKAFQHIIYRNVRWRDEQHFEPGVPPVHAEKLSENFEDHGRFSRAGWPLDQRHVGAEDRRPHRFFLFRGQLGKGRYWQSGPDRGDRLKLGG